jgi:division protein CdvB (Snf7/Vps24/ESCRT-III family)
MRVTMKIRQLVIEEINDNLFELGANYKIVKNEEELAEEMMKN